MAVQGRREESNRRKGKGEGRAVTKTSHSQTLQRASSVQPWIRDHYAALRAEAGPRLHQTRAVVVPVIMDTSHKVRDELVPKVRDEYIPAAVELSSHMAEEAMHRSAPLRAELSDRAAATVAAARGQLSTAQLAQLGQLAQLSQLKRGDKKRGRGRGRNHNGHTGTSHRKLWLIGGATAAGAALGAAAVLWQRSRYQAWVEDDATQSAMDDTPQPERLNSTDPSESNNANAHASSGSQHKDQQ